MTNEELTNKIQMGENITANMATLWGQNIPLIRKTAAKYKDIAELDDLLQEAYLGLHSAAVKYDPDKGTFITYALAVIRGYLLRYIENSGKIRIPNHLHQNIRNYNKSWNILAKKLNREPSDEEIRAFMGLTVKEYGLLTKGLQTLYLESLDQPIQSVDDEGLTLAELIPGAPDPADGVSDQVYNEEVRTVLWSVVDELPEKQATAIRLRYQNELEYGDIAEIMGISYQQARDCKVEGIRNLRKPYKRKKIARFLPDCFYGKAFRGNLTHFRQTRTSSTEYIAMRL